MMIRVLAAAVVVAAAAAASAAAAAEKWPRDPLPPNPNGPWFTNVGDNKTFPAEYPLDTAKVLLWTEEGKWADVALYGVSGNCYKCITTSFAGGAPFPVDDQAAWAVEVQARWEESFELRRVTDGHVLKKFSHTFGDHGVYTLVLSGLAEEPRVTIKVLVEPQAVWIPLVVAGAIYLGLLLAYLGIMTAYRRYKARHSYRPIGGSGSLPGTVTTVSGSGASGAGAAAGVPLSGAATSTKPGSAGRLASLDTVRGIAIGIMIFVNYGGGGYFYFDHSKWNGLTFADLVFPWFIFMMGTSMALSFRAQAARGTLYTFQGLWKIIVRVVKLWCLGMFLNNGYDVPNWRIPGVLQRFAVSYLVVSIFALFVPESGPGGFLRQDRVSAAGSIQSGGAASSGTPSRVRAVLADIMPYLWQWLGINIILAVWIGITYGLDVPGCGRGYLGPGGLQEWPKYENCTGGAAGYVDSKVFGRRHIYQSPTCMETYQTGAYDPEGTLGYLTSIWLVFLGLQSGRILVHFRDHKERIIRFMIWGVALIVLGLILCGGSKNEGVMPLTKNLWSLSFVAMTGGQCFVLLAFCYFTIDVKNWWTGSPFLAVGQNVILIYLAHEILNPYFPFSWTTTALPMNTHAVQLLMNAGGATCWFVIAWRLAEAGYFFSV